MMKGAYIEGRWERFSTTTLHSSIAVKENISMSDAMEFNFPNVQYIFDNPRRQSGGCSRGGKTWCSKINTASHSKKNGEK